MKKSNFINNKLDRYIKHIINVYKDIDGLLKKCLTKIVGISDQEADNIIKKIKSDLEKVRLRSGLRLLYNMENTKQGTFLFLGSIFILESLVAAKQRKKTEKVQKLLRDNLDEQDKLLLLSKFLFSKPFEFRKSKGGPLRHIMFAESDKDAAFKNKYYLKKDRICNGSRNPSCYCVVWLKVNSSRINEHFDTLVKYLYEMRHAIVHESFPVAALPNYRRKYGANSFTGSINDVYPVFEDIKYFRSYQVYIDPDDFLKIIKKSIKNYLLKV